MILYNHDRLNSIFITIVNERHLFYLMELIIHTSQSMNTQFFDPVNMVITKQGSLNYAFQYDVSDESEISQPGVTK